MISFLKSDLKRLGYEFSSTSLLRLFFGNPSFRFIFLFRAINSLKSYNPLRFVLILWYKRISRQYGMQIPLLTEIGKGILFKHFSNVVINQHARIGSNCTIMHGVTIGKTERGRVAGTPTVGDRVYLGVNSIVVGNITIGNDVLIAPLSYVNFSIPDNAVVSGNPATIINFKGSIGYIKNIS